MKFLAESELTNEMKRLAKASDLRIAIAYWGADSLGLLGLDSKRTDVQLICCFRGGKSDPDVIQKFGKRALQSDKLHAKVIWSPTEAIVGSANASSNGLPEEENIAKGLIEAGVLVDDSGTLGVIKHWFDQLLKRSRDIKKTDLDAARTARRNRIWGEARAPKGKKRSLIEALREGGKVEFLQQKIYFALYTDRKMLSYYVN